MNTKTLIVALATSASAALAGPYIVVDNDTDSLYRGPLGVNGGDSLVAPLASTFWGDLSNFNATSVLATDVDNAVIQRLNAGTGAVEATSAVLDRAARSIAYDAGTDTVYGLAQSGSFDLFTINLTTGATTTVGAVGVSTITGAVSLAFDPVLASLVMTTTTGELYTMSTADASTALIGNMGITNVFGVEYDPTTGGLYASGADRDAIFEIDRSDASVTFVNSLDDATFATGLAFVPAPGAAGLLGLGGLALARRRR
ncbi:MAG: hypothetical protein RIB60_09440 [Phycisphaerales bacterium]